VNTHRLPKVLDLLVLAALLLGACGPTAGGTYVWIDVPLDGLSYPDVQPIQIEGHAAGSNPVTRIEILVNGTRQITLTDLVVEGALASFQSEWAPPAPGAYTLSAVAFSGEDLSLPDSVHLTFGGPAAGLERCLAADLLAPDLLLPEDGATVATDASLVWAYPPGGCPPEGFTIEVATDETFAAIVADFTTDDPLATRHSMLLDGGSCYAWRARALASDGSSANSDPRTFCVEAPPDEPIPAGLVQFWADPEVIQAGTCTNLYWHVENASKVVFGGLDQPMDGSYRDCLCEGTSYSLTVTDLDGMEQKYRVAITVSGSCITPEADTTGPPAPTPAVPANGLTLGCAGSQNLVWLPVDDPSGIDEYQLQVQRHSGDGVWQEVSGSIFSGITDKQRSIPVECGWTYRWRVRAVDGAGNIGSWSAWWSFTITLV
jgi:hypothetical protein